MQDEVFIGVDVAKHEVVYAIDGQSQAGCVSNDLARLGAWLKQFAPGTRIAMESTGRYHQLLANLAHQAGLRVYVLNPADVRHFRQSNGIRAKTDRIDAQVIAQMLAERHTRAGWRPWCAGTQAQQEIDALLRRRATLAVHRGAIEQAFKDMPVVGTQLQQALAALGELVNAVDREIQQRVLADERLAEPYQRLREIDGVGKQTAAALVNLFARVPFTNADAVVAYVGFVTRGPMTRVSARAAAGSPSAGPVSCAACCSWWRRRRAARGRSCLFCTRPMFPACGKTSSCVTGGSWRTRWSS